MSIDNLKSQILEQYKKDMIQVVSNVWDEIESSRQDTATSLHIPTEPRYMTNPTVTSSNIASGIAPKITQTDNNITIQFWDIPYLERVSTYVSKGYSSIPIWSMLNWGSGHKVQATSKVRGLDSVSVANYLRYSVPLRHRYKDIAQTMTKHPIDTTESNFKWVVSRRKGDRMAGYYLPIVTIEKINAYRASIGKKQKLTTQNMAYYTAQLYIEKSVSKVIGKLREILNNSGLIKKVPLR